MTCENNNFSDHVARRSRLSKRACVALVLFACPLLLAVRVTAQESSVRVATEADMKDAWPMFRANAARTGYVAGKLASELHLQWVYQAPHRPSPAWPRSPRMPFDRAYQTVLSGHGIVVFGSSVDNTVYALDSTTGREMWRFVTDGPIRFAPAVGYRDRVYVASDDGPAITRVFGVNLHDVFEFGDGQEYQDYFISDLGGSLETSDVELVIGLDQGPNDSFVMPVKKQVEIYEDEGLHRHQRQGYYGWAEIGFGGLDNRRVLAGSF